ncbi:hypothetical protein AAG906_015539 [Vitis piasezkii]
MLSEKKLPKTFWAEAVNWIVHILNRSPALVVKNMTPEEAWMFGCISHVHVPDIKRTKLEDKSFTCVLLGVSEESKAYRLYDPIAKKIVISRDVVVAMLEWGDNEENVATNNEGEAESEDGSSVEEVGVVSPNLVDEESSPSSNERRVIRPPVWMRDYEMGEGLSEEEDETNLALFAYGDPFYFEEPVKSTKWRVAMDSEIKSIENNDTWVLIDLFAGAKKIGVKWIYKTKLNKHGKVDKYKARLVAKGYTAKTRGVDGHGQPSNLPTIYPSSTPLGFEPVTLALIPLVGPQMLPTLLKEIAIRKGAYPILILDLIRFVLDPLGLGMGLLLTLLRSFKISGVVPHHMLIQHIPNFGHAERHSRVPSLGGLHGVHDQHPNIIHASHVNLFLEEFVVFIIICVQVLKEGFGGGGYEDIEGDEGGVELGMAWDFHGGFEREFGWSIAGMVGCEGYVCMVPIHVGRRIDMRVERIDRVVGKSGLKNGFNGVDKWRDESSCGNDLDDEVDSSLYFTFSSYVTFTTSLSFSMDLFPLSQPPVLSHRFLYAMSPLS